MEYMNLSEGQKAALCEPGALDKLYSELKNDYTFNHVIGQLDSRRLMNIGKVPCIYCGRRITPNKMKVHFKSKWCIKERARLGVELPE